MASTSTCNPHLEESAPSTSSTSGGSSVPDFLRYEPPTTKLAFHSDKRYHVFLSFRGPDVRKTLVDHLFEALSTAGLKVYKDDENLEKGKKIWPSLEGAIKSSSIRIPIFSRGYADSVWCLKEASEMLKTPDLIIPLFYHVNPTHVRYPLNESSPYKESFLKHYGNPDRHPRGEVDEWKHALLQISGLSGWSTDSTQGYEARLVKTVVNDLIRTLDRVPLHVAKHPVGMDKIKNPLIQKLNPNSADKVIKVGIWGIGGIGKTTVAKALYNQLNNDFEAASFIFNVRTNVGAESIGLPKLQKKIIKDLTTHDIEVDSVDRGISLFTQHLGGKRVLLILDDVDDVKHLAALVGDWLCSGSRVIITSRDERIFKAAQVSSECVHEITGLEINESLQLFCWHAFLRASPSLRYEDLSKKIVEACKGHPLSLEVLGSYLYGQNDIDCWKEALDNITLRPEIHDRLYISYQALSDEEKEIFLDIACFFIGEKKAWPIIFWKSLYKMVNTAVSNLSMKLLIKIDEEGVFDMHDHLQDMGRSVAKKEGTRQWEAAHPSTAVSNNNLSRLRVNGSNLRRLEILYRPGLRYLHLQNLSIEGITEDTLVMLPPRLIWLRMEDCSLHTEISRATKKRRHSIKGTALKLKTMQLESCDGIDSLYSLNVLPDTIGNLSQLQHLGLGGCGSLNVLPDTIGNLSQLQHLDLGGCGSLNVLPDTIGNLSQLQHLDLRGCGSLNVLPDTIGNLSQLQHLDLGGCGSLNVLPDTIGNLSQLQHLDLRGCGSLNVLPHTIGNLSQLQHLDLRGYGSLNVLPDTIGNLSQLQHLDLGWCGSLNVLPHTIGNLSQLQHLDLRGYGSLNVLPDTIGNLSQLQHLGLGGCGRLNVLPDTIGNLSQLQHLGLGGCVSLNVLPDTIGNLSQLQHLGLGGCGRLNVLPDTIGNLSQLQHLGLGECGRLNVLPDTIGNLSQLQHLGLPWCRRLNVLPDTIGNLSQLQHLDLGGCGSLNVLPDTIGNLSQLQHLDLRGCGSLNVLPDTIGNLSQLQHLDLGGCGSLNVLPDTIGNLSQLQHLDLFNCRSLRCLPDTIRNMSKLQHLDLSGCRSLNNLSDIIGNLSQVNELLLDGV